MYFEITEAQSKQDLTEILQLQANNHRDRLSEVEKQKNGFLSVKHDPAVLEAMNHKVPQIIAKANGRVVGFAMVMLESFSDAVPELRPLFETLRKISYKGKKITEYQYYVMGQICVDEKYRSLGMVDKLYQKHKEIYSGRFEICVTEIASGNIRSMKAHQRVGFEIVHTFRDATDEWNIVVWNWKYKKMDGLESLKKLIHALGPLPEEDWSTFVALWTPFNARRKEILTAPGETEKYLYFVVEGVQRVYYFDEQNREATLVFSYPPSFGGVLDSLMLKKPSRYFYETLTPSIFLRAPFADLEGLMKTRPSIENLIREGITQALSGVLERLVELQCFSSEEKFKQLMQRSPHIFQLVPHKYLANYLGIDPTNFSKLINKTRI